MAGEKLLAVGAVIIAIIALICAGAAYTKDGIEGPQGEPGPQGDPGMEGPPGVNGTDGTDGMDGSDGEDCECNEPPTIKLFCCGDGIMSHGEWCDDGNLINGDGCDCDCTSTGPPYKYILGVRVKDPDNDKMTIDIYYKFGIGGDWNHLEHTIGYSGDYRYCIDNPVTTENVLFWLVEVTDGPNIVWASHGTPLCITP